MERLRAVDVAADLGFVLEAIRLTRARLGDRAAVIGICGAPFTLAAYLIEGGPSRDQLVARAFMRREPRAWHALMEKLTDVAVDYVAAQAAAGAQVIQVFDSWAGSLSVADYRAFVAPHSRRVLAAAPAGTPVVHFATGSAHLLGGACRGRRRRDRRGLARPARRCLGHGQERGRAAGHPGQPGPGGAAGGLARDGERGARRAPAGGRAAPATSSTWATRRRATRIRRSCATSPRSRRTTPRGRRMPRAGASVKTAAPHACRACLTSASC